MNSCPLCTVAKNRRKGRGGRPMTGRPRSKSLGGIVLIWCVFVILIPPFLLDAVHHDDESSVETIARRMDSSFPS